MKYFTYINRLAVALAILCVSACNGDSEAPEDEEDGNEEESGSEDVAQESNDSAEEEQEGEEEGSAETEADESLIAEEDIFNDDSMLALANKENQLSNGYEPHDLVTVDVPTVLENPEINQLREDASLALSDMFAAARSDGINLYARSGYRSYNTQSTLYNNYIEDHGQEAADRFSAEPGSSEHQTGLAMDVTSESVNFELAEAFGETEEGAWVRENAHEFGFIIRYPEGAEEITGYMYEPWHLRYLGEAVATDVYDSGLTYEEYIMESGMDINEEESE